MNEIYSPDYAGIVCQKLARYGRLERRLLLQKLYDEQMLSFDLDRTLLRLKDKIKTEQVDGVTYYELR